MPEPSILAVLTITEQLEELLNEERTFTVARQHALAVSTYTRARGLLRSMRVLTSEGEPAGCGLIARALYEDHLVAALVVDGNDNDRERLLLDFLYWAERHAKEWNVAPPTRDKSLKPKPWDPSKRAQRVAEIYGETSATDWYRDLYRVESFASVHAGIATSSRHVVGDIGDDNFVVVNEPATAGEVAARLIIATILMANIARNTWQTAGFDLAPIDRLVDSLGEVVDGS